MNDQNDDAPNYALMALAGVVALVVVGVIALVAARSIGDTGKTAGPGSAAAPMARGNASDPAGRIYFELGSEALPAGASELLVKVADAAREQAGRRVLITGFHDASGDAVKNAELAKNRALAVRHALEANGVSPERLVMDKPAVTSGDADARGARRVEVRLR